MHSVPLLLLILLPAAVLLLSCSKLLLWDWGSSRGVKACRVLLRQNLKFLSWHGTLVLENATSLFLIHHRAIWGVVRCRAIVRAVLVSCWGSRTWARCMHQIARGANLVGWCPLVRLGRCLAWYTTSVVGRLANVRKVLLLLPRVIAVLLWLGEATLLRKGNSSSTVVVWLLVTCLCCALLICASDEGAMAHFLSLFEAFVFTQALRTFELLSLSQCLIMVVTLEELLNARSLKFCLMLNHLLWVGILPLTVCVLSIEVVFIFGWPERSRNAFFYQGFPVKACKPLMFLDDMGTFLSQTISRLTLDETID